MIIKDNLIMPEMIYSLVYRKKVAHRIIFIASFLAFSALPQLASAQSILKNRVGPWDVMCETPTGASAEICALVQKAQNKERQNARIGVTIGRLLDDGSFFMRVTTPLGVFLPNKLKLNIDGAEVGDTPFIKCWPGGCITETPLSNDLLNRFFAGRSAIFTYSLSPDISISFEISLAELKSAIGNLQ